MPEIGYYLTSDAPWARNRVSGLARIVAERTEVTLTVGRMLGPKLRAFPRTVSGLIGPFQPADTALLRRRGMAWVNMIEGAPGEATVMTDYRELARMVVNHLTERGMSRLAAFREKTPPDPQQTGFMDGMLEYGAEAGMEVLGTFLEGPRTRRHGWSLERQLEDVSDWLRRLPKPCGIVAGDDDHGRRIVRAAGRAGFRVPGDFAVVGIGNDPVYCESEEPTLTSVALDQEGKGYAAGRLLLDMLEGRANPGTRLNLPPRGLVIRSTTGFGSGEDPNLDRALRALTDWEPPMPSLEAVAQRCGMSLSTLHRHVRRATGQAPGRLLQRARLEKALALLRTGEQSLAEVADGAGYGLPSQLSREIKQHTGLTARQYRRRWR